MTTYHREAKKLEELKDKRNELLKRLDALPQPSVDESKTSGDSVAKILGDEIGTVDDSFKEQRAELQTAIDDHAAAIAIQTRRVQEARARHCQEVCAKHEAEYLEVVESIAATYELLYGLFDREEELRRTVAAKAKGLTRPFSDHLRLHQSGVANYTVVQRKFTRRHPGEIRQAFGIEKPGKAKNARKPAKATG